MIQDFPIRGHAVYLHIRRRKWLEKETGRIVMTIIDLSHEGTGLTEEFASFLKKIGSTPQQYL
jgi:transposase